MNRWWAGVMEALPAWHLASQFLEDDLSNPNNDSQLGDRELSSSTSSLVRNAHCHRHRCCLPDGHHHGKSEMPGSPLE
jgi:hypothetical protein